MGKKVAIPKDWNQQCFPKKKLLNRVVQVQEGTSLRDKKKFQQTLQIFSG